jgi:hypothetical protein
MSATKADLFVAIDSDLRTPWGAFGSSDFPEMLCRAFPPKHKLLL